MFLLSEHNIHPAYTNALRGYLCLTFVGACCLAGISQSTAAEDSIPRKQLSFLNDHCLECHNDDDREGGVSLSLNTVNWSRHDAKALWERVLIAIQSRQMPPDDASEVSDSDRAIMANWLDETLTQHSPVGGTPARRLNRAEYKGTIESLFGLKNFSLPQGFPQDREHHGFDNLGEGLVLSPPLLESYAETAQLVADVVFPPERSVPPVEVQRAAASDLVISYSSGKIVGDALRLGMKCDPIMRSCTWPSRIETTASGIYTITVQLSAFRPNASDPPMIVKVLARDVASKDSVQHKSLRVLQEIEVTSESPEAFSFDAELFEEQTPVVHWANAALDSDRNDKTELRRFFVDKDRENPRYLAAWNAMLDGDASQGFRGGIGWERVKKHLDREDLQILEDDEREALLRKIMSNPVLYAETVVFDVFENGPALQVHGLTVEGPLRLIDGPREIESQRLQKILTGGETATDEVIGRFLSRAFRRPADEADVQTYLSVYNQHLAAGHTHEQAMHLVIRNVLISPRFLYRCLNDGELDDYDLATRLSYFLTGSPPDDRLLKSVGRLSDPTVLRSEASRLLPTRSDAPMITNFTGQWLDTRKLPDVMPDPRFKVLPSDETSARLEVEHFFLEMLKDNRPMTDFIDPDFTWTSARIAKNIYQLDEGFDPKKSNTVHRVTMQRGGRHGGVLGQAAVMMATANGVDTQPVLRGVWVLENILGMPPPPPPQAVPPITPDTTGAKTPRDLLSLHTTESSCAGCHRKIDPVGFVLENFDPVGRWRDKWPGIDRPIDSSTKLPDGTEIRDIVDFKAWLVANINQFSECLAQQLMTYATGRVPNYTERKEIAEIVRANHENGNGFRDLLLTLIDSRTFRTK